ncbi:MAG: hypothetical protein N4A47_00750 [Clostridia bacterium]|jgi:hypothetical protein|nr:hypothetical protein [Clostridia bacterium]
MEALLNRVKAIDDSRIIYSFRSKTDLFKYRYKVILLITLFVLLVNFFHDGSYLKVITLGIIQLILIVKTMKNYIYFKSANTSINADVVFTEEYIHILGDEIGYRKISYTDVVGFYRLKRKGLNKFEFATHDSSNPVLTIIDTSRRRDIGRKEVIAKVVGVELSKCIGSYGGNYRTNEIEDFIVKNFRRINYSDLDGLNTLEKILYITVSFLEPIFPIICILLILNNYGYFGARMSEQIAHESIKLYKHGFVVTIIIGLGAAISMILSNIGKLLLKNKAKLTRLFGFFKKLEIFIVVSVGISLYANSMTLEINKSHIKFYKNFYNDITVKSYSDIEMIDIYADITKYKEEDAWDLHYEVVFKDGKRIDFLEYENVSLYIGKFHDFFLKKGIHINRDLKNVNVTKTDINYNYIKSKELILKEVEINNFFVNGHQY